MQLLKILCLGAGLLFLSVACDKSTEQAQPATKPKSHTSAPFKRKTLPIKVEMKLVKVTDRVWYAQGYAGTATEYDGFISNAGVVITDAGILLFDALGSPGLAETLVEKIREISSQPIVKVVVSHYHADHIYGLQVFKDMGAEIIGAASALEYVNSEEAKERLAERRSSLSPWVDEHTRIVAPDKLINGEEIFTLGGVKFQLNLVGKGHSNSDITMFVHGEQVFFPGDLIFEGRVPFVGNTNGVHWLEALKKIELIKLHALVPGHGVMAQNPQKAIRVTREYLEFLRDKMGEAVKDLTSFEEAYAAADWSAFKKLPAFDAVNRGNAFRVYRILETESLKQGLKQ